MKITDLIQILTNERKIFNFVKMKMTDLIQILTNEAWVEIHYITQVERKIFNFVKMNDEND